MQVDKEVEAITYSHDMSKSPLSNALPSIDRFTNQNVIPHVDTTTELDARLHGDRTIKLDGVPHVDRATKLDNSSLFFKDRDCQSMEVELQIRKVHRFSSPTQEKCNKKVR